MQIIKEFYPSGNLKFIASVEGSKISMLRFFGENDGIEKPINKDEYEFGDDGVQYIVPEYAKSLSPGVLQSNPNSTILSSESNVFFRTSRYQTSVDEMIYRINTLSEEVYKNQRRIDNLEESSGIKPRNKITISVQGLRLVVGREINRPTPPNPAGWHCLLRLNLSGFGNWRNIIWIKGIWEHNFLGKPE